MSNPLSVIVNPPGIQYGMPGDIVSLYAVVINEGDQSAVIDLFFSFDETFQKISGWSNSPRASLAVAPFESSDEVTFDFEIPADALAGTYDYTFVVDSPEHYPQDTPINFPGQLKVLLKEQTVIRASDPTFSIIPATNPNKPITKRPDQPLQVVVKVENRSNRVDRFRLSCPDLDDNWFKISYPATGLEGVGLFDVSALELNPNTEGEINVELRPTIDTLAGSYSPTIRLLSENNPDLILLDLIYIDIPRNYQVGIELNTILGRVSRKPGKYELVLSNQGNLIRELYFNAKSRDEEEICTYKFEPRELRLLPNMTEETILTVKPRHWWRRPLFGEPLVINFQVDITDMQSYPLTNASPQATLSWKARPWWQFLLLILLGLGLFAGASYLIWRMLNPDPLTVETFEVNQSQLIEGDEAELNLTINNYPRKKDLIVTVKPSENNEPILNNEKIAQFLNPVGNEPRCRTTPQSELICVRIPTGVRTKGKHVFELKVTPKPLFNRRTQSDIQKNTEVEIKPQPVAEIIEFGADRQEYKREEKIRFNWKIQNSVLLKTATINIKTPDKQVVDSLKFEFKEGKLAKPQPQTSCKDGENQTLTCTTLYTPKSAGTFSPELTINSSKADSNRNKQAANNIKVLPKPFKIVFFRIGNIDSSDKPNLVLPEGERITVSWKVEGENVSVNLGSYGNVAQQGTKELDVIRDFPKQLTLQVRDGYGEQEDDIRTFFITVEPLPTPTPTPASIFPNPAIPAPSPTRNPFKVAP